MTALRFPNEPDGYRSAREALLEREVALREQVAEVARQRRALPLGGVVPQDYEFTERTEAGRLVPVRMSELFANGRDTLFLYSFMFAPDADGPCAMCSSFLDGLNGNAAHLAERINLAVVARAAIDRVADYAERRGWHNLRMLSAHDNSYQRDYLAENEVGEQLPMANVFVRRNGAIHHTWGSEMFYAELDGQPRHVDQMWPLWNVLDTTPDGRGEDWYPGIE